MGCRGSNPASAFKLFHEESRAPRMFWMQSLDDADVLFSVVTPEECGVRYGSRKLSAEQVGCCYCSQTGRLAAVLVMIYKGATQEIVRKPPPLLKSLSANLRQSASSDQYRHPAGCRSVGLECDMLLHDRKAGRVSPQPQ